MCELRVDCSNKLNEPILTVIMTYIFQGTSFFLTKVRIYYRNHFLPSLTNKHAKKTKLGSGYGPISFTLNLKNLPEKEFNYQATT